MMKFADGSTMSFTPDPSRLWEVQFTDVRRDGQGDAWTEPLIGWGVVISAVGPSDPYGGGPEDMAADIQPVVLDDGRPSNMYEYCRLNRHSVSWRLVSVSARQAQS